MTKRRIKGEGSIYQVKDGYWIAAIDLGWVEGKRKRRTFRARSQSEALQMMREFRPYADRGEQLASGLLTVGEYLDTWVTKRIPGTVSVRTEEIYERSVRLYITRYLGKIRLRKLTPCDVSNMMTALAKRGLSPSTVRMARATLRRALRMAEQDGLVTRNVAAIADGPKMDHREGRTMTPTQARQFLAACRAHRLGAAYSLALSTGLRRGEVLGLQWSDICPEGDQAVLSIRRQLVSDKTGLYLSDLKTKGSRRTLYLSTPLIDLLEEHHRAQNSEMELRGAVWRNELNLVFTTTYGLPLDPSEFGKGVSVISKKAGLGHWSIHELRHSCASLLFSMKVPLEAVADQLGHASVGVTKDVYVHLLPGSNKPVSKAIQVLLFQDPDQIDLY